MAPEISIICLIYKSTKLLNAVYESALKYTPKLRNGEAEFLFVANNATDNVLKYLSDNNYNFISVKNLKYTEDELFKLGYGEPSYISGVYRGYNQGIIHAKGEKIVLINSDNFFSENWLENLLKYWTPNRIISSQLVERNHEKFGVFPGAIERYFGYDVDTYRDYEFNNFSKKIASNGIKPDGAYMPCLLSREKALLVGLYPTGNIALNSKQDILYYGDEYFYSKLKSIGVKHYTALDSIVYHLKEGEKEENLLVKDAYDSSDKNNVPQYPIIPFYKYKDFYLENPVNIQKNELYNNLNSLAESNEFDKKPLVSIIIPVYNGSNYLKEAIDSVLAQTYKNIEVIVVNDGSTDNTEEIVLSYGNKIRYFSKNNGGVSSALNMGIEKARGDYISWLSHDDKYYSKKIEIQIKKLNKIKNKNVILFSDYDRLTVDTNKISRIKIKYNQNYESEESLFFESLILLLNSTLHGCSLLIPKKAFEKAGLFDCNLKTVQDYAKWYEFIKLGYRFCHIKKSLILQRIHYMQDTISKKELHSDELKVLNTFVFNLFEKEFKNLKPEYKNFIADLMDQKGYKELSNKIKTLNVLQIGDTDLVGNKFNGHDLHLYLQENDIESNHLVCKKLSKDKTTFKLPKNKSSKEYMESIIFSELFQKADIIHLHLIHNTQFDLNYLPLITKLKPTLITLHDGYYLSGHCIHGFDCKKWQNYCQDCPYLEIPFRITKDKSAFEFYLKKKNIQDSDIKVIVASKWMKEKIEKSPIWENKKIYLQPFGIDQQIFKPVNKNNVRKTLGIPQDALVLMFRSDDSKFKGLDIIKKSLKNLKTDKKIVLLTVAQKGLISEFSNKYQIKEYGWVKDDKLLAKIYQSADLFLMPSTQEAFGMMAIEAMSCGVPVLALTGTALQDVINSPVCGQAVDESQYSRELQRFIDIPDEISRRGKNSFLFARENYNKDTYINNLIKIYQEIINNHVVLEEENFILKQLLKYVKSSEIQRRFLFADDILWRLIYRLTYRVYLKYRYGKKVVKEKYDKKYL